MKQEYRGSQASLGYIASPCLNRKEREREEGSIIWVPPASRIPIASFQQLGQSKSQHTVQVSLVWGGGISITFSQKGNRVWVEWCTLAVPALERLSHENFCKSEASLGYQVSSRTARLQ